METMIRESCSSNDSHHKNNFTLQKIESSGSITGSENYEALTAQSTMRKTSNNTDKRTLSFVSSRETIVRKPFPVISS